MQQFDTVLVIDKNIFISNLNELKQIAKQFQNHIAIYVSWVVIQELDDLKSKIA